MIIKLWWCEETKIWNWIISKTDRPIVKREIGQHPNLHQAMKSIENSVKFLMETNELIVN